MMKAIVRYAVKSIKFNMVRSVITALICFVCTAFFVAETLTLWDFKQNNDRALDNTFGTFDGIFACDGETLSLIQNDADFTKIGTVSVIYNAIRDKNYSDRKVIIGTADENAVELQKIRLNAGEFPKNSGEIALEQTVADFLFPNVKIGDKITLTITDPDTVNAEFTLVGILANFSDMQWRSEEKSAPMINALIAENGEVPLYYFASVLGEVQNPEKFGGIYYPNQRDNYDALKSITGISSDATAKIIIAVLAFFTLMVMIITSYALSRGNEKNIGLMKTAGFSGKTILLFLTVKSVMVFVPSAFLGTFLGMGISAFAGGELSGGAFAFAGVCGAAAFGILLICNLFFSQIECRKTVVENLRNEESAKSFHSTKFTSENPAVLYSVKNFLINGKETAAACVMIFLSVFAVILMTLVIKISENSLLSEQWAFDISLSAPAHTVTELNIARYYGGGLSDNEYEALRAARDVEYAMGIKRLNVFIVDENNPVSKSESGRENMTEQFISDAKAVGFPNCALYADQINGLDDYTLSLMNNYLIDGKIDINALKNGTEVIRNYARGGRKYSVGDKIKIGYGINHNPPSPKSYDELEYDEFEVTVCAVVSIPDGEADEITSLHRYSLRNGLLWSEEAYENIGIDVHYNQVYLNAANKKEGFDTSVTLISELQGFYGDWLVVQDHLQEHISYVRFLKAFEIISAIISGGLSLFSLISLALVTASGLSKRKKVFGYLRAVGMTKRQMAEMILPGNVLSVASAFAFAAALGFLTAITMNTGVPNLLYPSGLAIIYLISAAVISMIMVHRSFKTTIIDCISEQ